MTTNSLETLRIQMQEADARALAQTVLDSVGFWDILAERDRLRQALSEYANPANWEMDAEHVFRVWLEPGSSTPESYDGFHLARIALKEMSQ